MKQDDIDRLFSKLETVNHSDDLTNRIIVMAGKEKRKSFARRFYMKMALMGSGMIFFGFLFLGAAYWLINDLNTNGTYQFFSMMITDFGSVVSYIDDLFLAILESLPVASLIATLASALVIFVLLRQILSIFLRYRESLKLFNHKPQVRL
ncbi:MAG: hypothetical protein HY776_06945 [Actinobacteria bacterium]|nr:hypothetical protein [Actinomycetota bacterium]